jgi:hypothetical protein
LRQRSDGILKSRKVFRPNECQAEVFATLFSFQGHITQFFDLNNCKNSNLYFFSFLKLNFVLFLTKLFHFATKAARHEERIIDISFVS